MRVLKEGTRLADRYTLLRRLGSGGMSEVWLANDARAGQRVALKFLKPRLAEQRSRRDLFRREWQAASRLMHPNIARVFEYHDDDDGPWYSQQFIDGPDAGELVGLSPTDSLRPFALVADALRYAHGKDMVHRDIKASNLLFDSRGVPYLVDFGMARPAAGDGSGGTPIASSPQQLSGEPPAPADDIYALGVLMHEILSGQPPPGAGSPSGGRTGIDDGAIGASLRKLLDDMLASDPARRPAAEDVARRLQDAGIAAGPVTLKGQNAGALPDAEILAEDLRPIRPVSPAKQAASSSAAPGPSRGVSPSIAFGGLAVLLVLFLAVIFWLPDAVRSPGAGDQPAAQPDAESVAPTSAGEEAPPAAEPAARVDPATMAESKAATDEALGDLLSRLERLRYRGIEKWGGQSYLNALDVYEQGDRAYLERDYDTAGDHYREAAAMLEPFFDRIDTVFGETMAAARAAFAAKDHAEAVRLYDLAVSITPGHAEAEEGLERARSLKSVLDLVDQAVTFENQLDLQAAKLAFERALELDPAWEPASAGLERVQAAILQRSFEQRMTEGLEALSAGNLLSARAAFEAAKALQPDSQQPVDGLLQVDQELRLANIRRLEQEAASLEANEEWQAAIDKYQEISEIDSDLQFVRDGLTRARERAAIHQKLDTFIADPDALSAPATLRAATQLLLQVTTMSPTGPRLENQKNELSRLLKRAATPLTVQLVSDNQTEVAIYRVGKLGTFATQELSLPPGAYVATGSRIGFRDVRLEFRVAPEIDLEPIVIKCEERI